MWPPRALVGRAVVGPLWPLVGPLVGPLGPLWAERLWDALALVGRAPVGPLVPLWAGPWWHPLGRCGLGPCGPPWALIRVLVGPP